MIVAGVDGCPAGWIAFKVEVPSLVTSVEVIDLAKWLQERPAALLYLAIDIPIGLVNGSRACDKAARILLGQPRGSSCVVRRALRAKSPESAARSDRSRRGDERVLLCYCALGLKRASGSVLI